MAFETISADSIDRDQYLFEPFGQKGIAELFLRTLYGSGDRFGYVKYSTASAAKLRKAAKALQESDGMTFRIEKAGTSKREVTIARKTKNGKVTFTREYLNAELVSIEALHDDTTDTDK